MVRWVFPIGIVCAAGSAVQADVVRVGEFGSLSFEGFEGEHWSIKDGVRTAFGGLGEVFASDGENIHIAGGWSLGSDDLDGLVESYSGKMLGSSRGTISYRFDEVQRSFGGYFATIADVSGGTIEFYDANGRLVGQDEVYAAIGGQWRWNGWASDAGFLRVEVRGAYRSGAGGFLLHDSVRVLSASVGTPGGMGLVFGSGVALARRHRRLL